MATKLFEVGLMASEDVQAYVGSCKSTVALDDGAFVTLGALATDGDYGTDYNCYTATAPAAATDDVVVVDIAGVSEGVIAGNNYKVGVKLCDLQAKAGYAVRFRRLMKGDKFWLCAGNFASAPVEGQYAAPTAGATTLTPASSKPATGLAIKIVATKPFILGSNVKGVYGTAAESEYLCEVL